MREIVPNRVWVKEHSLSLAGARFLTRMTVLRLNDGLCLHSPVEIDEETRSAIAALGEVRAIVAPSTFHHLFVASAQTAFPGARTYGIAGLEKKRKDLRFDALIGDDAVWPEEMDQVVVGNRVMREIVFVHRGSRTCVATDLVENFRDETPGTNGMLRFWMRAFGMWGRPRAAPELQLFTRDKKSARAAVEKLLAWDFDRAIISHGEILDRDPKQAIREAWKWVLAQPPR